MHTVLAPPGQRALPALGLGTAGLGETAAGSSARAREVSALRLALQVGYRLIDTAEMYGDGGAEEVVGAALRAWSAQPGCRREDLFVISKVLPHNASRRGTIEACERSLARLGLDRIDLYLLHWRGPHPLGDTVAAFEELRAAGRIGQWGVSNFDLDDLRELWRLPAGEACAADQVYYCASERGVEFDLLPALRQRGMPLIAYTPLGLGRLARDATLATVGARYGATAAQAALAWLLAQPGVIAIPKAVQARHLRENLAAASLRLDAEDCARIDRAHPPPSRKRPLAMI